MLRRGRWLVDFEYLDLETNNLLHRAYSLGCYEDTMAMIETMHNKSNIVITSLDVKYPDFTDNPEFL